MHDAVLALQRAPHAKEARGQHRAAITLEGLRPGDDIGDAGFVLERGEDHAVRAAGTLPDQDDTRDLQYPVRGQGREVLGLDIAEPREFPAQQRHGMRLERHAHRGIVGQDMLAERHGR